MKRILFMVLMALLPTMMMAQKQGGEVKRPQKNQKQVNAVDNTKYLGYNIISSTEVEVKLNGGKDFDKIIGTITIPSTVMLNGKSYLVTKVASMGFYFCKLSSVKLPSTIKTLDVKAFQNCEKLESIILPESVESIGWQCFCGCNKLKTIIIPASVKEISIDCFYYGLQKISVSSNNAYYSSEDGVLYNKDKTLLHTYPGSKQGASFTIPSTVKTIADCAFRWNWENLETVIIPSSVKSIGDYAFAQGGITSIDIPSSVQTIGKGMFWRCSNLQNVTVPEHLLDQLRKNDDNFGYCESLKTLNIRKADGSFRTITIADLYPNSRWR